MSVADLIFVLPLPPSANRMWRRSGRRIHPSAEYDDWKHRARICLIQQAKGAMLVGRYRIAIVLPEQRKDADNLIKPLGDALQRAGIIENDRHLRGLTLDVDETRDATTLRIDLWSVPGEPAPTKPRTRHPAAARLSNSRASRKDTIHE